MINSLALQDVDGWWRPKDNLDRECEIVLITAQNQDDVCRRIPHLSATQLFVGNIAIIFEHSKTSGWLDARSHPDRSIGWILENYERVVPGNDSGFALPGEPGLCMDNFVWDDDIRYRFECTENGSNKFYEITLTETNQPNTTLWSLQTAYGSLKPGAHITHKTEDFSAKWRAEEAMNKNIRKRLDHGYKEVR